jgi:uncharacterized membrane protein YgdD (TMEM256/DUF423 family)
VTRDDVRLAGIERAFLALAATAGLAGVALAAAAAHVTDAPGLKTAADFLLVHAPVLVGLVALVGTGLVHARVGRMAAALLVAGLALFSGDLALRALAGVPLFRMAAPTGGLALMAGWAMLAVAALWPARR